jgi:dTDP-4-dehydrorhamnose reductase
MKVLVIGDGLLGSEIIKNTAWDYISRKKNNIDFTNLKTYKHFLNEYDTIVNCIAYTNTYSDNKEINRTTNYQAVTHLSDFCLEQNKKLIHISTSYVYASSKEDALETDLPLISKNWYTYYKLLADEYIMLKNKNYLICRICIKPNPFPYDNAWIDQIGNFDYVDIIAKYIINMINNNIIGLFNVGTNKKTIYDLAIQTNANVQKTLTPLHIPKDISMNLDKFKKIKNEINF